MFSGGYQNYAWLLVCSTISGAHMLPGKKLLLTNLGGPPCGAIWVEKVDSVSSAVSYLIGLRVPSSVQIIESISCFWRDSSWRQTIQSVHTTSRATFICFTEWLRKGMGDIQMWSLVFFMGNRGPGLHSLMFCIHFIIRLRGMVTNSWSEPPSRTWQTAVS